METPSFVYITYIGTTAERLWRALTEPVFTERYWGVEFETDWKPGSSMTLCQWGLKIADPEQRVLESERYRRLVYKWHTFEANSQVLPTISQGWPHILSNLKTLLETGETLPIA